MRLKDYVALLESAIVKTTGVKLSFPDAAKALQARRKFYRIREQLRAEERAKARPSPAIAYSTKGEMLGVLDICGPKKPEPTRYDGLCFRVTGRDLLILNGDVHPRGVDALDQPQISEVEQFEAAALTPWPYFR
jgi:hypothetical protein